ncbi:MAG: site-specific DNA-methyltransferase [Halorientalis sp.]
METQHRVVVGDARSMTAVDDNAVDLVVTSPPYPLIEMWDDTFAELDPAIGEALDAGEGDRAFEVMHDVLDSVWAELDRVLAPGAIVCINVGDATRTVDGEFCLYPNHAEITSRLTDRGLVSLPDILWRKPTNSPNKFLGSGTLPPNAYPTLEHEHVLLFRNGSTRAFPPGDEQRYESAYFWEERNEWFSDLWDVPGEDQHLDGEEARDRSGAYPLEIPLRLIYMFSTYGDTVLDPFWGTGTTTLAAMVAGRNSIGYETDPGFREAFGELVSGVSDLAAERTHNRLDAHREFVAERRESGTPPDYQAEHYEFPVVTKRERQIQCYTVSDVRSDSSGGTDTETTYHVTHEPY